MTPMSQGTGRTPVAPLQYMCLEKRKRALLASNSPRDILTSDAPKARLAPAGISRPGPCSCYRTMDRHPRRASETAAMKRFLRTHANLILGVLSGFDRLRFRGTL